MNVNGMTLALAVWLIVDNSYITSYQIHVRLLHRCLRVVCLFESRQRFERTFGKGKSLHSVNFTPVTGECTIVVCTTMGHYVEDMTGMIRMQHTVFENHPKSL